MAHSTREGYRYLQVDRLVTNRPSAFLSKVRRLGEGMLGEVTRTGLTEQGPMVVDGELDELRTRTVAIRESVVDVYPPDAVRLLLLRKSVPTSIERRYNFNHQAARFTAQPKFAAIKGESRQRRTPPTIGQQLDVIAEQHGVDPRSMIVEFNRVQELSDLGFGTELALVARIGTIGSIVLREQAKLCSEALAELSSNAAYPTSPMTPTVPFMRVPENVSPARYDDFVTSIYEQLLPIQLTLGGLDAHSRTIAATGC